MPFDLPLLFIAFWIACVGASVGSFLNVVIYRVPAGMSIALPASHCPLCQHAIRWYDNLPIFGWIRLRGRCRDCRAPISLRYPLIEGTTAAMFVALGYIEVLRHPVGTVNQSIALYGYHLLLVTTLLAAGMIAYDGLRLPWRLFWPAAVVGIAAGAAWPWLHRLPLWHGRTMGVFDGPIVSAAGLVAGAVMGNLSWLAERATFAERKATLDLRGPALCAGIILGWQATVALTLIALAAHGVLRWLPKIGRVPAALWFWVATLFWIANAPAIAHLWRTM